MGASFKWMSVVGSGTAMGLLVLAVGCAGSGDAGGGPGLHAQALRSDNGLVTNGLVTNGLVTNGLVTNGLVTNGLVTNGFETSGFRDWFNADPAFVDMLMQYLVRCAVPAGQTRAWTNPSTGVDYAWTGELGLAPEWSSGAPASELEQQLVTACLGAHVNESGQHVEFSLRGQDSAGTPIAVTSSELADFSVREGCFFGNLFAGEGFFAGRWGAPLSATGSASRTCALAIQEVGSSEQCAPMVYAGTCAGLCELAKDGQSFTSCTVQGKTYAPLTTAIQPSDVYRCGDGVCQPTESCGTGATAASCRADCGTCP